jgi:hypothetical protein
MPGSKLLRWLRFATVPAILAGAAPARAAPTKQQCVSAYEETQVSMRRSHLLAAKSSLQTCLDESCPAVLRSDCAGWLKEVEARTPSVVVECVADGAPARDGKLLVDGTARENGLDGRAMELDPGSHTFTCKVEGGTNASASADALLKEGDKLKVVRIDLTPNQGRTAPPPAVKEPGEGTLPPVAGRGRSDEAPRRPVPWGVYAASGLGVVAAAGFTTFAILGTTGKNGDLEPCKPNCSEEQISTVRQKYIVADVFLGVTVISALVAGYLYFTRPEVPAAAIKSGQRLRLRLEAGALAF